MTAYAVPILMYATTFTVSPEGRGVALERARLLEGFRTTHTLGHVALRVALDGLTHSCRNAGWDGYGALPIDGGSVRAAHELLDAVPPAGRGVALTVGVEADGQITLEWHRSPAWTLSVSVSARGELHYSALLGHSSAYGTEPFDPVIGLPETLRRLIRRVEGA